MKKILKPILRACARLSRRFLSSNRVGDYFLDSIVHDVMSNVQIVKHNGLTLLFATPNLISRMRVDTFSTKEPETLQWINSLPEACTLWDIGANVGTYSVYAAKRGVKVVAFEPSVFNLELLSRNLFLNDLQDNVKIVPLALSDSLGIKKMRMTTTDWGGALSSFGEDYGWDGRPIASTFVFQTLGISMDEAVKVLRLPPPLYIKMDVDGIEHIILQGGIEVLTRVQGVIIEINDEFEEQAKRSEYYLSQAGLKLKSKQHAQMIENSEFNTGFNQIWVRD